MLNTIMYWLSEMFSKATWSEMNCRLSGEKILEHEQITKRHFYSTEVNEESPTGISCKMDTWHCGGWTLPALKDKVPEAVCFPLRGWTNAGKARGNQGITGNWLCEMRQNSPWRPSFPAFRDCLVSRFFYKLLIHSINFKKSRYISYAILGQVIDQWDVKIFHFKDRSFYK